ncbi:hypothetical protein AK812_SmicGene17038 [Symbiodinium microadriaticum]|uniref:DUF4604 domain-containing protein n=1 Tax=Symbiodinium microadriaticum TaxID=2951 RepID=A0A1Q9DYR0_SYMMI|nr:hypothetical protein AK812_SmicGene17038 [Symbiodinium microadriaticum]
MSDDEGPRGKGGKRGGKGGGKGGGGKGGDRKGGKGSSERAGGGSGGGFNVSRLQVMPKFLQEIHQKYKPSEAKRGLNHAELQDKISPLGRNDGDEYDFEDAQIVDSDLTAEEIRVFQRKRSATGAPSGKEEEPNKEEDGKMKFQKKADRSTATAAATRKLAKKLSAEAGEAGQGFSMKKQRLSFDAEEGDDDDD